MNYTLNQLQVFLKVTQTMSVTKAAEELHLTQPAVSIQLRNFQEQFDIPLTEVVGRKIYITDFGHEIAEVAESILNQVALIDLKTQVFKGRLTGRLRFSIVSTAKYVLPYFLSSFMKNNEGVEVVMDIANKNKVIESLEANSVDFSLVSITPATLNIEKIDLLQNKLFLVGNRDHSFDVNSEKDFKDLPLIYRENGSGTRQLVENFIEKNRLPVIKRMELNSNEAVKQAVLAGLGYSIMPLIGIKNELLNEELKVIPVAKLPIKTVWQLIWLKGKRHSPAASAFLKHLKEAKREIVSEKFEWYEQY